MRIIMIADAPGIASFVTRGLNAEGWSVDCVRTRHEALLLLKSKSYDVLLLDLVGSDADGAVFFDDLDPIPQDLPLLVLKPRLSGKTHVDPQTHRRVPVLQKPFDFDELIARIEALGEAVPCQTIHSYSLNKAVSFEPTLNLLHVGETAFHLTAKECALLQILVDRQDRTCAKEWLLHSVWKKQVSPMKCPVDEAVESLRKKLGPHDTMIQTVRSYGYRFNASKEGKG